MLNPKSKARDLPGTDPSRITALWRRVMAGTGHGRPTAASQAKQKDPIRKNDSGVGIDNSDTSSKVISTDSRRKTAKITATELEELVLKPKGTSLDTTPISVMAFHHFNSDVPNDGACASYYHNIKVIESTTVWLEGDDDFAKNLVWEYNSMGMYKLCRAE